MHPRYSRVTFERIRSEEHMSAPHRNDCESATAAPAKAWNWGGSNIQ